MELFNGAGVVAAAAVAVFGFNRLICLLLFLPRIAFLFVRRSHHFAPPLRCRRVLFVSQKKSNLPTREEREVEGLSFKPDLAKYATGAALRARVRSWCCTLQQ